MAEPKIGQPVSRRLGDLLVREGLIDNDQLARALQEQKGSNDKLGGIMRRAYRDVSGRAKEERLSLRASTGSSRSPSPSSTSIPKC